MSETQASFALRGRNPDVLTCIANLSNDEVFTPPEFANRMLDTLAEAWAADHGGANLWADKTVKFLDPFTKSGVFLREITSRLAKGLADEMPNLEERVDHILTKQVFGIGITYLTSLLARRSLYCSKNATGKHSIGKGFISDAGNIWFKRTEHTWEGEKCKYCGANRRDYDRGKGLETHAYAFIHTDIVKTRVGKIFGGDMQFDVIIGNALQDVITKLEPDLFLAVTGLTVKDFHLLVRLKVFNTEQMNQAVFAFRRYEDASLRYTGIESHEGLTHYGLYDTVVARE